MLLHRTTLRSQNIWYWILETIARPRTELDGLPICPFVKQYLNNIQVIAHEDPKRVAEWFVKNRDLLSLEAVVVAVSPSDYDRFYGYVDWLDSVYQHHDVTVLGMHQNSVSEPLPLRYTYQYSNLIILQRTSTLEQARKRLESTTYYQHWQDSAK
jgi:hypothetical protein